MSFTRLSSESHIYVYRSHLGIHCHWCAFGNRDAKPMGRVAAAIHVLRHKTAGDQVPKGVVRRILTELS